MLILIKCYVLKITQLFIQGLIMTNKNKNEYGNDSIYALKGADRVRKRPAVIFGSDGLDGCKHSFFEILSNSIDEAREGYGNKIIVTKFIDNSISIEDYGRGIPVDYNAKENRFNWELIFCELYAGGKYNTNSAENYEFSLGLNGLGLCATQYSSEYMDVQVIRDKYLYKLRFEKGEHVGELIKEKSNKKSTGTIIKWKPDIKVFNDICILSDYFENIIKKQAIVNPGILFLLLVEEKPGTFLEFEYIYEEGIKDYLKEIVGENALTSIKNFKYETKGKDREDKSEYKVKMNFAFTICNKVKLMEFYHNSSYLEYGGSPEKAVKQAFISQIDSYLKQNNKYLKNESKIIFNDIEESLAIISSSFSTQTSYENQTKKSITNKFIYDCMTEFLKNQLEIYFIENPDEAFKISEQVLINKRSRENAEKARLNLKKKLSDSIDFKNRIQKFVDCRTKDKNLRELYIVEGDSALGACKQARDANFQAIIPVRGKILNCLKSEYEKIFKNDIILDILRVLGCGIEIKSKSNKEFVEFNLENLRWHKIVICTDADVDGFQIRTLILTMIYRLVPSLIDEGLIYIAESPLFEINTKDRTYFAYTEKEKSNILRSLEGKSYTLQRSKGLGENEPDMMWLTTMNPETRRLIKISKSDIKKTEYMFDMLLGDNLQGRKDFISENGYSYLDDADIS